LALLTCLILFVGCNFKEQLKKQLEKFVPKEADKFARAYLDILREGDFEQAEKLLDPQVVTSKTRSKLQEGANLLKKGKLISMEIVGVNIFETKDKSRNSLTYQLQFKDTWLLVIVIVDDISGKQQIYGVNVKTIPKSLEEINAFTLSGKSFRHYIILLLAAFIPVFMIYTIVLCVRTKMKRKWLWIILILIGVGKYNFNWTSGQMGYQPISLLIPGASVFKGGPYAPWIISISIPLGALLFILKMHKMRKSESVDVFKALDADEKITEEIGL
jgi:hypothetical protein